MASDVFGTSLSNGSQTTLELQTVVREQQIASDTMEELFEVLSEPNTAMQGELSKMTSAFQRFMEKAESRLDALSQENTILRGELAAANARNAENEKIHQQQMQEMQQLLTALRNQNESLIGRVSVLEGKANAADAKVATLENRYNGHAHVYDVRQHVVRGYGGSITMVDVYTQGPNK